MKWQRDGLIAQRKATPILQISRRKELAEDIESLNRQIEGRKQNKENLLKSRHYPSEKEMQEVGKRIRAGNEKLDELTHREKQHNLALQRGQTDYRRWTQSVRKEDTAAVFEAITLFRSRGLDDLTDKLKNRYGADFESYLLQGAIHDTDRWCVNREISERNPKERKSVRAFLERNSYPHCDRDRGVKKHREREER